MLSLAHESAIARNSIDQIQARKSSTTLTTSKKAHFVMLDGQKLSLLHLTGFTAVGLFHNRKTHESKKVMIMQSYVIYTELRFLFDISPDQGSLMVQKL